ncbi:hypothetical protein ACFWBB_15235 [Streptomyces sp. NPDC060000]|uniref:hypothetical protein n=1 Tax=Streptomyces sp. NPDC060000 TaxID=3347031 RepID=UPI0036BC1EF9
MGVLARLFRRSKATEETAEATEATGVDEAPVGPAADDAEAERPGEPTSAQRPGEARDADEPEAGNTTEPEPVAVAATDGVEIPRQQSAEEAADSEAGEGARA